MKYILFTTLIASSSAIGLKAFDENDESGIEVANSTGNAGGAAKGSTRRNGFNGFNKPVVNPQPKNGFSPYDSYFGKGVYNNNSGNSFEIKNSNTTDAVVLLVNAFSGRKIRNEYVRKNANFEMTGVPNGTYYLEWFSGENWSPDLIVGSAYKGGFQTNANFTKTRDSSDWMKVDGYQVWTVTLYSVVGGDVESEEINAEDFFN